MKVKLFDVIGLVMVIAWVGVVGNVLMNEYVSPQLHESSGQAVFREGESYMLLTREDAEVGYLHESRTNLRELDAWLLEYELMLNVSMLGLNRYLRTEVAAKVDRSAYLLEFTASISTAGTSFEVKGVVNDKTVEMSMVIAGSSRVQSVTLQERPRLSNSALNELIANPDLEPGMMWKQQYFDPTTMRMTEMTFEFVREHQVNVYDVLVDTFHFRQKIGGTELDAYVDKHGEVQLQEFPLRIVGAKVPLVLGKARAAAIETSYQQSEKDGTSDTVDLSLEATMNLVRAGTLSAGETSRYRISGWGEGVELQLDSGAQYVMSRTDDAVEIDTAQRTDATPDQVTDLEPLLAETLRIDTSHPIFAPLGEGAPESTMLRAELIARNVARAMRPAAQVGVQTASSALEAGTGDCTEYALVLVAALRSHGVPARFVSGVKLNEDGQFILHQWVQYYDHTFVDLDATTESLLPETTQIQLFTHNNPEHPEIALVIDKLTIEPIVESLIEPEQGDFN